MKDFFIHLACDGKELVNVSLAKARSAVPRTTIAPPMPKIYKNEKENPAMKNENSASFQQEISLTEAQELLSRRYYRNIMTGHVGYSNRNSPGALPDEIADILLKEGLTPRQVQAVFVLVWNAMMNKGRITTLPAPPRLDQGRENAY